MLTHKVFKKKRFINMKSMKNHMELETAKVKPSKDIESFERLREDLIDIKITEKFFEDAKSGKKKLITQDADEFLKDFESW